MAVDYERLKVAAEELVELSILRRTPTLNSERLRRLIRFLKAIYTKYPPERMEGDFVVVDCDQVPKELRSAPFLTHRDGLLEEIVRFPAVVQAMEDGTFCCWNRTELPKEALREVDGLAYILSANDSEYFWVEGAAFPVRKLATECRSGLATPTFWELQAALDYYKKNTARHAIGAELQSCFVDDQRLRWVAAPEHKLRDSLWLFLKSVIRGDVDIEREFVIGARKPVDIFVSWRFSRARALIEIKWLGTSFNAAGQQTSNHTPFRARRGAVQLRDYVLKYTAEHPDNHPIGYLVIFDGRREKVKDITAEISYAQAWAYEKDEITYPKALVANDKFTLNLNCRFFIEPVVYQAVV